MANMLYNRNNAKPRQSSTLFNKLYNTNPSFRKFADSMKGKTPEQAFREHGLDFNDFKNMKL